ncbi:hypothetical protein LPB67_17210 [Undibacterium sp. Jales W-56]|uniref:hypothetical protein n=1 Tax=Undibacterium sp. Jales W-56 TaxID=2897325 RepID=UPI0021CE391B|nr:hypothetical protein [Undibacterium sp. Jales W-56]MCU6435519.1 hypothetical protein [Undibacterium sp. Jales W-56]
MFKNKVLVRGSSRFKNTWTGQKKTAITGGFLEIWLGSFSVRLPFFHRRWLGIAKVKKEKETSKFHIIGGSNSWL